MTYSYDGNGRRVMVTTGAGTTIFVYDAMGNLAAEYTTEPQTTVAGTSYLTVDHLGSTRMTTDSTGTIPARFDYQPFGKQLSTTNRATTAGYGQLGPRQKFTGKERDAETGLDYFGARYFSGAQGRFTSPDAFYKDSHVADPQSWNKYAYARDNPLRYVDPTGEEATMSSHCTTDSNNNTTCNVSISASIAIYAVPGSDLSQAQLKTAASTIQNTIQNAWSGSFQQDGVTYNVSTNVSVQVAGSESAASKTGAQNVIGLMDGPVDSANNHDSMVSPRNTLGSILSEQDTGVWNYNSLGGDTNQAAHEFAHLLGVGDKPGSVLSNTSPDGRPRQATAADLGWGIQEATGQVHSTLHPGPFTRYLWGPAPTTFSNQVNTGAPVLGWWK
jgi:RHS repeat-associated protein